MDVGHDEILHSIIQPPPVVQPPLAPVPVSAVQPTKLEGRNLSLDLPEAATGIGTTSPPPLRADPRRMEEFRREFLRGASPSR